MGFIHSSEAKKKKVFRLEAVEVVLNKFNELIANEVLVNSFSLNTATDHIPYLSEEEVAHIRGEAMLGDWHFSASGDNYNTKTYTIRPI